MTTVTRKNFLQGAALAAGSAAVGASAAVLPSTAAEAAPARRRGILTPGTYTNEQDSGYALVTVTCTFDESGPTKLSYEVGTTCEHDYFVPFADAIGAYCDAVVAAGTADGVDTVAGASLCSKAIADGYTNCLYQALGIDKRVGPEFVNRVPQDYSIFRPAQTDLPHVFSPLQVGPMTLRNRVAKACAGSICYITDEDAILQPIALDYYATMAENGVSLLVVSGGSKVLKGAWHPNDGQEHPTVEEVMEASRPLFDRVHAAGSFIGMQLGVGLPMGDGADEMTLEEIQACVADCAGHARLTKEIGCDFVEIKCSTSDALNAFYSRRANHRDDEYGTQNFENRTRLFRELIEAIQESCGEDFPIIALINGMEITNTPVGLDAGHITIEEGRELARFLEEMGVAMIQVRVGAPGVNEMKTGLNECNSWSPMMQHCVYKVDGMNGDGQLFDYEQHNEGLIDGTHCGLGGYLPIARAIKEVVSIPVGCVGDMDLRAAPDFLDQAIANGDCDLIFMNRPLVADPELVRKMEEGRRDEVAPCFHCSHCHDAVWDSRGGLEYWPNRPETYCRVNGAHFYAYKEVMPEGRTPLPAEEPKNVMVVGGGPAGMEAARIAAQRGHTVSLYESKPQLGGLVPFAQGVKSRHEPFGDLCTYLAKGLDLAGVAVNTMAEVDAELVTEINPDVVILATGGRRDHRLEPSAGIEVLSMEQAFGTPSAQRIAIVGVGVQAIDIANFLMAQGKTITMVNEGGPGEVDKELGVWLQKFTISHMLSNGATIFNDATVNGIVDGGLSITYQGEERLIPCEAVVEGYDMLPDTQLADEIAAAGFEVRCVGDCAEPWNIGRAIGSANLLARSL